MSIPRTTHQWLKPFYDMLEGKGNRPLQLGSPTGALGFFGTSGLARVATGTYGSTAGTTAGASGLLTLRSNGGTGTLVTLDDVVRALKSHGFLLP